MNKEIVLHVGLPKTGTTTIQVFCDHNREKLAARGVFYPCITKDYETPEQILAFGDSAGASEEHHLGLYYQVQREKNPDLHARYSGVTRDLWNDVIAAFRLSPAQKMLISHESISLGATNLQYAVLNRHFADFDLRIVIYIRRLDLWFESYFQQHVKQTPQELRRLNVVVREDWAWISFLNIVRTFHRAFPKAKLVIRSFDEVARQKRLMPDFFDAIDVPVDEELAAAFAATRHLNPSFTNEQVLFLQMANAFGCSPEELVRLRDALLRRNARNQAMKTGTRSNLTLLNKDLVARYQQRYVDEMTAINQEFGAAIALDPEAWKAEARTMANRLGRFEYREMAASLVNFIPDDFLMRLLAIHQDAAPQAAGAPAAG